MIATLWAIATAVFLAVRLTGNPIDFLMPEGLDAEGRLGELYAGRARELVDDLDGDERRVHVHHDEALAAAKDAVLLHRDVERGARGERHQGLAQAVVVRVARQAEMHLDRAEAALAESRDRLDVAAVRGEGRRETGWVTGDLALPLMRPGAPIIFLGLFKGSAHFAIDISGFRDPANEGALAGLGTFADLRTVAEGVETSQQRQLLALQGCHLGQGRLFGDPMTADQFQERLMAEKPESPPTIRFSA